MMAEAAPGPGMEGISHDAALGYQSSEHSESDAPWDRDRALYPPPQRRGQSLSRLSGNGAAPGAEAVWSQALRASVTMVDLRDLCSPVRDQGGLNSCTAFAVAALGEFLQNRQSRPFVQLSPRFLWYVGRQLEDQADKNVGLQPRDALLAMLHVGCSPEEFDPYPPVAYHPVRTPAPSQASASQLRAWFRKAYGEPATGEFAQAATRAPSTVALASAGQHKLSMFHLLYYNEAAEKAAKRFAEADELATKPEGKATPNSPSGRPKTPASLEQEAKRILKRAAQGHSAEEMEKVLKHMKECLDNWYCFVLAGNIYRSFITEPKNGASPLTLGVLPPPDPKELNDPVSQHCVLVVGYVEQPAAAGDSAGTPNGYLICRNSLGLNAGERGYFYLPYEYVLTPGCVLEAWTAR